MSLAVLLAQYNVVKVLDIDSKRVDLINKKLSTVGDREIEHFLKNKSLNLTATLNKNLAYENTDFIVIATPTNYNPETNHFDTSTVDKVVRDAVKHNQNALIVIKSTVPVGYTKSLQEMYKTKRIIFSPEFLREGQALKDNLYPSRIIIGSTKKVGGKFAEILNSGATKKNIKNLYIDSTEAEAVKLFANTYLAMRVSFFNELDSYALTHKLDTKNIINGVCLDERIGNGYNNPSFGYGGYCLPKDAKQLLANYDQVPQTLIQAIVSSNSTRKNFIATQILKKNPNTVGFFRLIMKNNSDNFRSSAVHDVIKKVRAQGIKVVIFEPNLETEKFFESKVVNSLSEFKRISDLIVANRLSDCLKDVEEKCFSRDLFGEN